ncbi:MAG: hypothetical protein ACPGYV_12685, partial [Phycisphaeraceae bacterium]
PGIYANLLSYQGEALGLLIESSLALHLGLGDSSTGMLGALRALVIGGPSRAFEQSPWFTILFGLDVLFVLGLSSGMLCRMAGAQICTGHNLPAKQAAGFVGRRWVWYVITPLMPGLFIALLAGVLALAGLIFFNVAYLEVLGSVLFGLLLLLGLAVALVSVLLLFGFVLMPAALSVEASDGFDAISRSFNYVLFKPWQFAGYLIASLVYLAVIYLLVVMLLGLAVGATHTFVGLGAFAEIGPNESEAIDGIAAQPTPLRYDAIVTGDEDIDDPSIRAGVWVMRRWGQVVLGLLAALFFSLIACMTTQVYVLMRNTADGTPMDAFGPDEQDALFDEDAVGPDLPGGDKMDQSDSATRK